jgi:hypothetical protein
MNYPEAKPYRQKIVQWVPGYGGKSKLGDTVYF